MTLTWDRTSALHSPVDVPRHRRSSTHSVCYKPINRHAHMKPRLTATRPNYLRACCRISEMRASYMLYVKKYDNNDTCTCIMLPKRVDKTRVSGRCVRRVHANVISAVPGFAKSSSVHTLTAQRWQVPAITNQSTFTTKIALPEV